MITRFFSPAGRTSPARLVLLAVPALTLLWAGARALAVGGIATFVLVGALWGLVAAKLAAEVIRRMHDRGRSAGVALLIGGIAAIVFLLSALRWVQLGADPIVELAMTAIALSLGVALLWPGRADTNRYGPPPARWRASGAGATGRSAVPWVAVLLILAGAAGGFGLFSWSDGVRQAHERDARAAAAYRPPSDPLAAQYNAQEAGR